MYVQARTSQSYVGKLVHGYRRASQTAGFARCSHSPGVQRTRWKVQPIDRSWHRERAAGYVFVLSAKTLPQSDAAMLFILACALSAFQWQIFSRFTAVRKYSAAWSSRINNCSFNSPTPIFLFDLDAHTQWAQWRPAPPTFGFFFWGGAGGGEGGGCGGGVTLSSI